MGSRAPHQLVQRGRQCYRESSSGKLSLKQSGSTPSQDAVTSRTSGSGRVSWVAWPVHVPQRAVLALGRAACVQVPGAVRNRLLKLRCRLWQHLPRCGFSQPSESAPRAMEERDRPKSITSDQGPVWFLPSLPWGGLVNFSRKRLVLAPPEHIHDASQLVWKGLVCD